VSDGDGRGSESARPHCSKVFALPGRMEQVSAKPKADDRQVTEVEWKKSFVKSFPPSSRHGSRSREPWRCRKTKYGGLSVLCQTLAKRKEISLPLWKGQ